MQWTGEETIASVSGINKSIYSGGVVIDKYDVIHLVLAQDDSYGNTNSACAIYYLWSPSDTARSQQAKSGSNVALSGSRWYDIYGHLQAEPYHKLNPYPMVLTSTVAASSLVATAYSRKDLSTYHGISDMTNTQGLAVSPVDTVSITTDNGTYTMQKPYFTFHQFQENVNNPCLCYVAWHDAASSGAQLNGWITRNISTALLSNGYDSSVRAWKGRHYGTIEIDLNNIIHVFGLIQDTTYANGFTDSAWWGAELVEWYSHDRGSTWDLRYITRRSSLGIGMVNGKHNIENNQIEIVSNAGYDVYYYSDIKEYGRMQDGGEDVVCIYSGGNSEVDVPTNTIADFWNEEETKIYYELATTIPTARAYDTAGMHYLYYGKMTSTPYVYNPKKIFGIYENFESYEVPSFINTSVWPLYNILHNDWQVVNSESTHTNKIFSGDKSLQMQKQIGTVTTAYAYTALPTNYTNNIEANIGVWDESFGQPRASFGIKTVDSSYYAIGLLYEDLKVGYCNGIAGWSSVAVSSPWQPTIKNFQQLSFKIVSNKITFYLNKELISPELELLSTPAILWFGYGYDGGDNNPQLYWDFLTVEKVYE